MINCRGRNSMKLTVRVIPKAKKRQVSAEAGSNLKVRLLSAPEGGKANEELVETLAAHLKVPRSRIKILSGFSSRVKIVEIK